MQRVVSVSGQRLPGGFQARRLLFTFRRELAAPVWSVRVSYVKPPYRRVQACLWWARFQSRFLLVLQVIAANYIPFVHIFTN